MRKKRWAMLILATGLVTACSPWEDVELTDVDVFVSKGNLGLIGVTTKKDEKNMYPSALTYDFTFQNTGTADLSNKLHISIKPGKKLQKAVQQAAGFNVFGTNAYQGTQLRRSSSYDTPVHPKDEGEYLLNYDMSLVSLPSNLTQKLKKSAYDATVIVSYKGKTIKQYPLDSFHP